MEPEPQPHAEADISGRDSDVSSESGAAYVAAERHKVEGTEAFKNGEFSRAAEHYEAALSLAAQCTDNADVKALVLALRLNCAAARLKTADPADALPHCEAALVLDPCSAGRAGGASTGPCRTHGGLQACAERQAGHSLASEGGHCRQRS
jgi:tetratricopeptide (TPR) repeat protein